METHTETKNQTGKKTYEHVGNAEKNHTGFTEAAMVVVVAIVIVMVAIVLDSHKKQIGTSQATRTQEGDKYEMRGNLQYGGRGSGAHFIAKRGGEVQSFYHTGFTKVAMVVVVVNVVMMVAIVVDSHRKHKGTSRAAKIQKGDA